MAIEYLLMALAVVLFGGTFLGLFLSYRETEVERARRRPAVADVVRAPGFFGWRARDAALAEELALRQIEHHLRREAQLAEQFINNPCAQTLRAGGDDRFLRVS